MRTIPLLNSDQVAVVDDADYPRLSVHRWYLSAGYARRTVKSAGHTRNIAMHAEVLGTGPGVEADHKDLDKLNNQRGNLRPCTRSQNEAAKPKCAGKSRFKGVYFDTCKGRWRAMVQRDGRQSHIGYFRSEEDAARAYDARACELFGEFARPNFPVGLEAAP
jgi:hypothetical protein